MPWAALYNFPLNTDRNEQRVLCPLFRRQLAANAWTPDHTRLSAQADLLDNFGACRSQAGCPLSAPEPTRRLTVCPFGFWGFRHQVEQPLQSIRPAAMDQVPPEARRPGLAQTPFLLRPAAERVRLAAASSDLPGAERHRAELAELARASGLQLYWAETGRDAVAALARGDYHIHYFFCHGEDDGSEFSLQIGPAARPYYITTDLFAAEDIHRPPEPRPLVILNGCETVAVVPERLHDFLPVLRGLLQASGVVGTETQVWSQFARFTGQMLLSYLANGASVGEAFLEIRRYLLRHYNPLGLVYTYYAPAGLHLHDPANCTWCKSRGYG